MERLSKGAEVSVSVELVGGHYSKANAIALGHIDEALEKKLVGLAPVGVISTETEHYYVGLIPATRWILTVKGSKSKKAVDVKEWLSSQKV